MYSDRSDIRRFFRRHENVAAIFIDDVKGSAPRDADAWMLVSPNAIFRTIGGGSLEFIAIEKARALLSSDQNEEVISIPLGPEIGQCCGGHVRLRIERLDRNGRDQLTARIDQEIASLPHVYIFGAGHVGYSLSEAMALLPVHPVLIDSRAEALEAAPDRIETCLTAIPESMVKSAPADSAFVVLTHDHSLDFLITREALQRGDARYVGLIGSKTKRATFRSWFRQETGSGAGLDRLICPIGGQGSDDKRPEVIASFVAAEIMAHLSQANADELAAAAKEKVREGT